jgi:hypothetical protein
VRVVSLRDRVERVVRVVVEEEGRFEAVLELSVPCRQSNKVE